MCIRRIFSDKDISTMMNSFSAFLFPVPRSLFSLYERLSFLFSLSKYVFFLPSALFILLSRVFHFLLPSSSISQTRAAARSLLHIRPAHSVFPDRTAVPPAPDVSQSAQMPQAPAIPRRSSHGGPYGSQTDSCCRSDEPLSAAAVVVSAAASDFSAAALVSAGLELPEQPLNAIAEKTVTKTAT